MIDVSIIIRSYNESAKLQELLSALKQQDFPAKQEIIVVDNGSTDDTAFQARKMGAKVVHLAQADFNYPRSSNLGIAASTAPLVVMVSAHALPVKPNWLQSAVDHFTDPLVAGVYGGLLPRSDASLTERCYYTATYYANIWRGTRPVLNSKQKGLMGATNCMLRKALWQEHQFDENYGAGAEDIEWGRWALGKGHTIIFEPDFSVYHSHGLKLIDFLKQRKHWFYLMSNPHPFEPKELDFRTDLEINPKKKI